MKKEGQKGGTKRRAILVQAILAQDDIAFACPSLCFGVGSFYIPGKTSPYAAQGMESDGCSQWVGAEPPRSASKGSPVAESIFTASSSCCAGSEALGAPSSKDHFWGCPVADAQPFTRDCRRRDSHRSQAVAGRHRSSRREQCPRESPPRSPPRGSEQGQIATSPGAVGVVQDVPRTSSEARSPSPRL